MTMWVMFFHRPLFFTQDHQLRAGRDPDRPRKLGLLAGTFEDGSFTVFIVPYPEDLRSPNTQGPTYGKEWDPL